MIEETKAIRKRTLPTIVEIGKRSMLSSGRWNDLAIADYIIANGQLCWIEVGKLAKIAWGHNNKETKTKVRRYLSKVKALLIDRGLLLVVETEPPHHRVTAVKIGDLSLQDDRTQAIEWIERMKARGELSNERYERAKALLG